MRIYLYCLAISITEDRNESISAILIANLFKSIARYCFSRVYNNIVNSFIRKLRLIRAKVNINFYLLRALSSIFCSNIKQKKQNSIIIISWMIKSIADRICCEPLPFFPTPYTFEFEGGTIKDISSFQGNEIKTSKYNFLNFFPSIHVFNKRRCIHNIDELQIFTF